MNIGKCSSKVLNKLLKLMRPTDHGFRLADTDSIGCHQFVNRLKTRPWFHTSWNQRRINATFSSDISMTSEIAKSDRF